MLQINDYRIDFIRVSRFGLDGGAMFGIVPKPLWQKTNPADTANRIQLSANVMVLRGHGKVILVDTGIGHHYPEKFIKNFNITSSALDFDHQLQHLGVTPEAVTDVVLTHLHFDHAGGSVHAQPDGSFAPRFLKATYHVHPTQWEWAQKPSDKDRGSYHPETFMPLKEHGQLSLLQEDQEHLFPGCRYKPLYGHSPGMVGLWVEDDDNSLFYAADLFPLKSHLKLPYIMAYDVEPLRTAQEKHSVLEALATTKGWLAFSHDPDFFAVQIERFENTYTAGRTL